MGAGGWGVRKLRVAEQMGVARRLVWLGWLAAFSRAVGLPLFLFLGPASVQSGSGFAWGARAWEARKVTCGAGIISGAKVFGLLA